MPKLVRRAQKVDSAGGEEFLWKAKQVDRHPKPTLATRWSLGTWEVTWRYGSKSQAKVVTDVLSETVAQ